MVPHRLRVGALILAGLALVALGGDDLVRLAAPLAQREPTPPRIVLRAASGAEQAGEDGSYCWGGMCVDGDSIEIPAKPLIASVRDRLTFEFGALGRPTEVSYRIYRYDDAVSTGTAGSFIARSAPAIRERRPHPAETVPLPTDLAPGHYAVEVFAYVANRGDSSQGFNLLLREPDVDAGTPPPDPAEEYQRRAPPEVLTPDVGAVPLATPPADGWVPMPEIETREVRLLANRRVDAESAKFGNCWLFDSFGVPLGDLTTLLP